MDFAHWDPRRPLRCHRLLELDWYDGWVGALGLFGRELEAPEWLLLERVGKCYPAARGVLALYLCTPVRSDFEALLPAADPEREHFVEWEWCTEEALEVLRAGVAEYACAYVILDTRPKVPEVAQHFELNGGEARSGSWARLFREDLTPPAPICVNLESIRSSPPRTVVFGRREPSSRGEGLDLWRCLARATAPV